MAKNISLFDNSRKDQVSLHGSFIVCFLMDVFGSHVSSHILFVLTVQLAVKCHGNCHSHSIIITVALFADGVRVSGVLWTAKESRRSKRK